MLLNLTLSCLNIYVLVVAYQLFLASGLILRHSLGNQRRIMEDSANFLSLNRIGIKHTANLTTEIDMSLCTIPPESKYEMNRHEERYTAEAAYMHTASVFFPVHLGFSLLLLSLLFFFFSPREYNKIIDQEFCHMQSVMFIRKKNYLPKARNKGCKYLIFLISLSSAQIPLCSLAIM